MLEGSSQHHFMIELHVITIILKECKVGMFAIMHANRLIK